MSFAASQWRSQVTVDSTQVAETQTGFAVLLTEANLPSALLDTTSGKSALSGGGDLLAYAEEPFVGAEPATRYALDVRSCAPGVGSGTAQIWVEVATVSSLTDTDLWLVWGDPAGAQPAVGDPYGRNDCNSAWEYVHHLDDDPSGGAPQAVDSAGNYDGTSLGTMTSDDLVAGEIGNGWDHDAVDDGCDLGNVPSLGSFSVMLWAETANLATNRMMVGRWDSSNSTDQAFGLYLDTAKKVHLVHRTASGTLTNVATATTYTDGAMHHVALVADGSNLRVYVDGAAGPAPAYNGTTQAAAGAAHRFGLMSNSVLPFSGVLDEVRLTTDVLSADALMVHYNNQASPGTFASSTAAEAIPSPTATTTFPTYYWYQ